MNGRLQEIADRVDVSVEELFRFLDSPSGRRLRRMVATGVIVSVPLVMRIPGLRRSPAGRFIEVAGGAAIVVKLAEWIRDWEHERSTPESARVIDIPPAGAAPA